MCISFYIYISSKYAILDPEGSSDIHEIDGELSKYVDSVSLQRLTSMKFSTGNPLSFDSALVLDNLKLHPTLYILSKLDGRC